MAIGNLKNKSKLWYYYKQGDQSNLTAFKMSKKEVKQCD